MPYDHVEAISNEDQGAAGGASSNVRQTVTTLTNAQMLALRATPITVIPAPGTGRVNQFLNATLVLNNVAGYTETADNMVVRYVNATGTIASATIETTGFIDGAGVDAITFARAATTDPILTAAGEVSNAVLVLHNSGDGEWGAGNAANTLTVICNYRVHQTNL